MQIPSREDWGDFEDDLDARYAFKVFFGKSISEAVPLIQENPIERTDELRFMPICISMAISSKSAHGSWRPTRKFAEPACRLGMPRGHPGPTIRLAFIRI